MTNTQFYSSTLCLWRNDGLVVGALTSGSSSSGLSLGQGRCMCFLGNTLYSHSASLCTRCINGYQKTSCREVTLIWTRIPSRGGGGRNKNISSDFKLPETWINTSLIGHLACIQTILVIHRYFYSFSYPVFASLALQSGNKRAEKLLLRTQK